MTLDIKKYFKNLINKEAAISHFQVKVDAGKTSKLKGQYLSAIKAEFGDNYLQDADYVLFFEQAEPWTEANIKSLFELTNRALGKDANMLSKNDFIMLHPDATPTPQADDTDDASAQAPTQEDSNILFLKITIK